MLGYVLMGIVPLALVLGSLIGARKGRLDPRDDLGLRAPRLGHAIVAVLLFLALSVGTEWLYRTWGLGGGGEWRGRHAAAALGVRIVMVALIYPIAEELFFRGFLFGLIRRRLGEAAAIVGSAITFALLHLQYDWRGMSLVLIDALFFGLVRSRTQSTLLTMLLHVLGNSYAVWQRLSP